MLPVYSTFSAPITGTGTLVAASRNSSDRSGDWPGDSFSVSVNGQLVSAWTDHRLKSGGVGFFADKGEIANLRSIHVIDNQDFLGWLCYQVSWWTADRQKSGVTHE